MEISVDLITPLTISVPTPFPYENTKEVPWNYDSAVYVHGRKMEVEPLGSKESSVNIVGTGGVTQRSRIFSPVPPTNDNGGTSNQDKGKKVESNEQGHDYT